MRGTIEIKSEAAQAAKAQLVASGVLAPGRAEAIFR
jgi:hypothetical protein